MAWTLVVGQGLGLTHARPCQQNELYTVTYPIFVHCFMEILYKGDEAIGAR